MKELKVFLMAVECLLVFVGLISALTSLRRWKEAEQTLAEFPSWQDVLEGFRGACAVLRFTCIVLAVALALSAVVDLLG